MKKNLLIAIIIVAILIAGIFILSKKSVQTAPRPLPVGEYEYYWGNGCPHCTNVANFLNSWENSDKVTLQKMEVWSDPNNAKLMEERYTYCKIDRSQMGVPLLFTPEGKCFAGDEPIINFFKNLKL